MVRRCEEIQQQEKNAGVGQVSEEAKVPAALAQHPKFSIQNPYKDGRREFPKAELSKLSSDLHKDVLGIYTSPPTHTSCTYTGCTQVHTHTCSHACTCTQIHKAMITFKEKMRHVNIFSESGELCQNIEIILLSQYKWQSGIIKFFCYH